MNHTALLVVLAIGSYLLGSIPFGMLVARRYGIDIFASGSGNPGATNVFRAAGAAPGILVFGLDVVKGLLPAVAARWIEPDQAICFAIGLVAVLGHSFSPFTSFRGGKGVSTALGAALGATPLVALAAFSVFLVVLAITRYVSLASTLGILSTLGFVFLVPGQSRLLLIPFGLLWILVAWRHRANYRRLLKGEEPKFRFKKKATADEAAEDEAEFGGVEGPPPKT